MEPAGSLVKNLLQHFEQKLAGIYPDQEIRQLTYILFEEYLGWQKTRVHLSLEVEIPGPVMKIFNRALGQLCAGKPVQYVIGKSWFNGTLLKIDANVLVPRPETEELCSIIKTAHQGMVNHQFSILDVGTGSGCIAIDLKKHFLHSDVTALDISPGAIGIAGENAGSNHCEISFIHADILDQAKWTELGKYHIIVSNPPYVMEHEKIRMHRNVSEYEPAQALFVADNDPLAFYRAISGFAVSHLIPPACLYFEINERLGQEVSELVRSFGFEDVSILQDFHGKERFVSACYKSLTNPHGK
jgi:release factor glutamine methyltransferase